jgi:hypothetical protein
MFTDVDPTVYFAYRVILCEKQTSIYEEFLMLQYVLRVIDTVYCIFFPQSAAQILIDS